MEKTKQNKKTTKIKSSLKLTKNQELILQEIVLGTISLA